jgi:apolipoprotein N-acyltransferase
MTRLLPFLCAALTGIAFYLSVGLGGTVSITPGGLGALALFAPVPVLWFAYKPNKGWVVFLTALAAAMIGNVNLLPAYFGTLPLPVLVIGIVVPALFFALSVLASRFVMQRLTPVSGVITFAVLWTAFDYLSSFGPNGAASSPAYSQVEMPWMIQSASVFGLWAVTFVIAFFAASFAMYAAIRQTTFAVLAVAIGILNIGYGQWRIASAPKTPVVHVGLAADDSLIRTGLKDDEASAMAVVKAYSDAARTLAAQEANLIIFPEKVAVLQNQWRSAVDAEFETAAHIGHATIVIGFDDRGDIRRNTAQLFFFNGTPPQTYAKRRLVPGLESTFVPGQAFFMLGDRTAVAICKDMDFPTMIRGDALLQPSIYAVPAWDFGKDAVWHARLAILRGVENGFAVARSANDGLLTLSDAYGRVLAVKASSEGGMVLLQGDLPRGPGQTLYARIGDSFAWICLAMSVLLISVAFFAKPDYAQRPPVL